MDKFKQAMLHHVDIKGLHCSCCNDFIKRRKPILNRLARQKLKQELKHELTIQKGKNYVHE